MKIKRAKKSAESKKPVVPPPIPHPPTEDDFDAVDAAMFNSDVLNYAAGRNRVRWYLDRWEKQFKDSPLMEETEDGEDDE